MSNSITELFQADPLQLTRTDFEAIIEHYRAARMNFQLAAKTTTTPASAKKAEKALEIAKNLDLDLGQIEL
jgi:hypothetical protein